MALKNISIARLERSLSAAHVRTYITYSRLIVASVKINAKLHIYMHIANTEQTTKNPSLYVSDLHS